MPYPEKLEKGLCPPHPTRPGPAKPLHDVGELLSLICSDGGFGTLAFGSGQVPHAARPAWMGEDAEKTQNGLEPHSHPGAGMPGL